MVSRKLSVLSLCFAVSLSLAGAFWSELLPGARNVEAEARRHHAQASAAHHGGHHGGVQHAGAHHGGGHHGGAHSGSSKHHRHHVAHSTKHKVADNKHAYPLDFFMMKAPDFERSPLDDLIAGKIKDAFARGIADDLPAEKLVRAGVFQYYPLSGGIFKRREEVKYIVLHSTETGIAIPAKNVINGWNSMGRRHPGAQFVVDRDGTIYEAVDPELASVHVNIFKTLPGINNDNTIGIEMNHTGRQNYPEAQRHATMRLVTYLQHRYKVASENVITHRYAQQGDHTDPVNFDLDNFLSTKEDFRTRALALKRASSPLPVDEETEDDAPLASVYVQIHGPLSESGLSSVEKRQTKTAAGSMASPAGSGPVPAEPAIAMPRGTFVAGGPLRQGSSPESENTGH